MIGAKLISRLLPAKRCYYVKSIVLDKQFVGFYVQCFGNIK